MPQGPVADYNILWVDGGPRVFRSVLQGHYLPFHIQKEKGNLIIGIPKALKAMLSSSSHKIEFGLLLLRGLAVREKFGIQFWRSPTSLRKTRSWCLVLGLGKLRTA